MFFGEFINIGKRFVHYVRLYSSWFYYFTLKNVSYVFHKNSEVSGLNT